MDKEDKYNIKTIVIILIALSALALVGEQIYNHFSPTREEQAQKAMLKLVKAFKEKIQDEMIRATEDLEQETQENKSKNKKKLSHEGSSQVVEGIRRTNNSSVISEFPQTKIEQSVMESPKVYQSKAYLKKDSQVESAATGVTSFGITIGKTTEKEIRSKFSVIEERSVIETDIHRMLVLDTKDFSSEKLRAKQAYIILNQQGIVEQLTVVFLGQHFQELHSSLSQKYRLTYKKEAFVGDHFAYYIKDNIIIAVHQPHMGGFVTYLTYVTKNLDDLCKAYKKRYQEQEKQRLYEQL